MRPTNKDWIMISSVERAIAGGIRSIMDWKYDMKHELEAGDERWYYHGSLRPGLGKYASVIHVFVIDRTGNTEAEYTASLSASKIVTTHVGQMK